MRSRRILPVVAAALATAFATASAVAQSTEMPATEILSADTGAWDPLAQLNRATFVFNGMVAMAVSPVNGAYRATVPEAVQAGVDNVFTNLREPMTAVSSGLQGDFDNAAVSVQRFAVNLVAGVGGILDVATEMGLVSRPEDFGTALCSYGIEPGPYIVLPLVGPSTGRDAVGLVAMYTVGYDLSNDLAVGYFVADGVAARLSDSTLRTEPLPADPYVEQRDNYLALREQICADAVPADQLKASPVGRIIRKPG
jgi:phospholipid-binding lipoprotein MlaA